MDNQYKLINDKAEKSKYRWDEDVLVLFFNSMKRPHFMRIFESPMSVPCRRNFYLNDDKKRIIKKTKDDTGSERRSKEQIRKDKEKTLSLLKAEVCEIKHHDEDNDNFLQDRAVTLSSGLMNIFDRKNKDYAEKNNNYSAKRFLQMFTDTEDINSAKETKSKVIEYYKESIEYIFKDKEGILNGRLALVQAEDFYSKMYIDQTKTASEKMAILLCNGLVYAASNEIQLKQQEYVFLCKLFGENILDECKQTLSTQNTIRLPVDVFVSLCETAFTADSAPNSEKIKYFACKFSELNKKSTMSDTIYISMLTTLSKFCADYSQSVFEQMKDYGPLNIDMIAELYDAKTLSEELEEIINNLQNDQNGAVTE